MNSFDDENTSPNFPQKSLPQKTMELAKLPRQALRALQAHSDPSATSSAQECSSARVIQLATSYSNSAGDTKPGSSIELPHSITVNGLSKSIGALKDIARLGSSFGQVLSVKFIEPTTALIIFLTVRLLALLTLSCTEFASVEFQIHFFTNSNTFPLTDKRTTKYVRLFFNAKFSPLWTKYRSVARADSSRGY
jgi:hypothetical protein